MFGSRLRELRLQHSYSMDALVEIYNKRFDGKLNKSTISRYENGLQEPMFTTVKNFAELFSVSTDFLTDATSGSNITNATVLDQQNIYMVPIYTNVSAGFGSYANDYIYDYIPCYITSMNEASETLCIIVSGDSMFPKIENGDIIQVHKQTSVDSGRIAVVLLDNTEALVKKVTYGNDWIELHSINPMYPVQRFIGKDVQRIQILGLVKKIIKNV